MVPLELVRVGVKLRGVGCGVGVVSSLIELTERSADSYTCGKMLTHGDHTNIVNNNYTVLINFIIIYS